MENKNHEKMKGGKTDWEFTVQIVIVVVLVMLLLFSFTKGTIGDGVSTGLKVVSVSEIVPTGTPEVYGNELGLSYDDVSPSNPRLADSTINVLSEYEDRQLNQEQLKRYIRIAGSISCEYCCGANSIIFSNGERACGCAHSYAMRGLAKYLLIEHPDISDEEILSELGKWKVLFFPGIHEQKAQVLESNGIDSKNYINLASNLYRGIEQGQTQGGEMVGGC